MGWHTTSRASALGLLTALLIGSTGCHQVIIDSGREPSPIVHHDEWNIAFAAAIFPAQVDASEYCGGEWASVETKQSFLNLVVEWFTFGIITPMETRIVCAASAGSAGAESRDAEGGAPGDLPARDPGIE
jgi:hypothetical protein